MNKSTDQKFNPNELVNKTAFLLLEFSTFGNFRKADVEIKSQANQDRFKHQKQLLESPELAAITKADYALKMEIDAIALPYKLGIRIIPVAAVNELGAKLKVYQKITRPALVEAFVATYEGQVAQAALALKENFNPTNYPDAGEVVNQFTFDFNFQSFAVPASIKDVAPQLFEEEKEKIHQKMVAAAEGIGQALATAAHELVATLADRLAVGDDGKPKRLHSTHLVHLQQFLNTFDIRNVTDFGALKIEMDKLKMLTEGIDVEKIKDNDSFRNELQVKFSVVAESLSELVTIKGRKFRDAPKMPAGSVSISAIEAQQATA